MKITLEAGDYGTYLICAEDGTDILIQQDWDRSGLARNFGWRGLPKRARDASVAEEIDAATKWLDDHIGKTVEDPGYFDQDDECQDDE